MSAFEFRTTPAIYVESGAAARLGQILRKRFSQARVCLVTDRFLHESGLLEPALADLKANGWTVQVIDDVIADTPEHIVLQETERARQARTEIVVGLGGGWPMHVGADVIADDAENVVLQASVRARQARAEIVVGLGGGSSMDVAELLAVLLASDQPLHGMYGIVNVRGSRLPLVQIPSTAG